MISVSLATKRTLCRPNCQTSLYVQIKWVLRYTCRKRKKRKQKKSTNFDTFIISDPQNCPKKLNYVFLKLMWKMSFCTSPCFKESYQRHHSKLVARMSAIQMNANRTDSIKQSLAESSIGLMLLRAREPTVLLTK
jgi:hypothetical protein